MYSFYLCDVQYLNESEIPLLLSLCSKSNLYFVLDDAN